MTASTKRTTTAIRLLHNFNRGRDIPVDLAAYDFAPINVPAMDSAARKGCGAPIALVYRNPIDQAASYSCYCQAHVNPAYHWFRGRHLAAMSFREYLFEAALVSYARQFISYQLQAARYPALVKLVPYEHLIERPVEVITHLLDHLAGVRREWPMLPAAVRLARKEHMRAIEHRLGRSLDSTRNGRNSQSHMRPVYGLDREPPMDLSIRDEAISVLEGMGVDCSLFAWPARNG